MLKLNHFFIAASILLLVAACNKTEEEPKLIFKYTFDKNGDRLDNLGQPATIPVGNAAQTPNMKELGIHSIELIDFVFSFPTNSTIIYKGETKTKNGISGIDFDQELVVKDGEILIEIPLSEITPGTYTFLRNSLGFQKGEIDFYYNDPTYGPFDLTGELASFVGYKTYISSFKVGADNITVNDVVNQGYWAFNVTNPINVTQSGSSPANATTVPNPLGANSPIPPGSCLVTGAFETPLVITGNETENITIEVAVTTNNSFEWEDVNPDGKFEPAHENVVDMGTRGLKARIL